MEKRNNFLHQDFSPHSPFVQLFLQELRNLFASPSFPLWTVLCRIFPSNIRMRCSNSHLSSEQELKIATTAEKMKAKQLFFEQPSKKLRTSTRTGRGKREARIIAPLLQKQSDCFSPLLLCAFSTSRLILATVILHCISQFRVSAKLCDWVLSAKRQNLERLNFYILIQVYNLLILKNQSTV